MNGTDPSDELVLYGYPLSACTHRVRLFLELLDLPYRFELVDLATGQQKEPAHLAKNPLGQVPVLTHGQRLLRNSHSILVYLALGRSGEDWLPVDPYERARVFQWLFFDETEIFHGVGLARNHVTFGWRTDLEAAQKLARTALRIVEDRLAESDWLEVERPTIADISCYPMLSVLDEAGLSLADYPHVSRWIDRLVQLPGFLPMPSLLRPR